MPTSLKKIHKKSPDIFWPGIVGIFIFQVAVLFAVAAVVLNHPNLATSTSAIQTVRAGAIVDGDGSPPREHGGFYHARNIACWHEPDLRRCSQFGAIGGFGK
jgi:hypothetical protein